MIVMWGKELCRKPAMSKVKKNGIETNFSCTCCGLGIPLQCLFHQRFIHFLYFHSIRADKSRRSFRIIHRSCILSGMKDFDRSFRSAFVNLKHFLSGCFSFILGKWIRFFRTCKTGTSRFYYCMSRNYKCCTAQCFFFKIITCRCCHNSIF